MAQDKGKLKWSSLIMGTLLLIVAVIIFSYPVKNFYTLTWLIGLFILINGVIQLLFRRTARALAGSGSGLIVVIGIIDIIFGLLVIFNVSKFNLLHIYVCRMVYCKFSYWTNDHFKTKPFEGTIYHC